MRRLLLLVTTLLSLAAADPRPPLPDCNIHHDNQCQGREIDTPPGFEARRWYTPARGSKLWQPSFQDYSRLVAYTKLVYSAARDSCDVTVLATHKSNSTHLTYLFDGAPQDTPTKRFDAKYKNVLRVTVRASDGATLELEPVDFLWNAPPVASRPGDYRQGQKGAIVELFGWPYGDVEQECPKLAELGYMGVKVFPPNEQIMTFETFNNILNPWYFYYQPVSYRLEGRMGTREQLRKMIYTCRKLGVRVYADAVINHMAGCANDANPFHRNPNSGCTKWGAKNSSLLGGPSPSYTQCFSYTFGDNTDLPPSQEFPAATYGPLDFHCERALNSWTDPLALDAGWLVGLTDLHTGRPNVQERIAAYLTDLISIGFSGFRVDAAKHIRPEDLGAIFGRLSTNMGGSMPADFISWLEVLLGGEADLLMCDPGSPYSYSIGLTKQLQLNGVSELDIAKIKIWNSGYPKETEKGTCFIGSWRSAIQNDDHDQQSASSSSRDMGDQGCVLIQTCNSVEQHRQFEVKLFTNPNGAQDNDNEFPIRFILSSFYWGANSAQGIPDGLSDCSKCLINCQSCQSVPYHKAFDASSTGYDGAKGSGGYTRTHRDKAVVNAMRGWVHLPPL